MADITGTGSLVAGELACDNTLGYPSKDVSGTGSLVAGELYQGNGTGLRWVDGEKLSYPTNLFFEEAVMSGTGKADNLARIPRATCVPIKAKFHTCNTVIKARFET